ncbi:MAG: ABC transporter permease, partial [Solirubrobacteraceae bacterium]
MSATSQTPPAPAPAGPTAGESDRLQRVSRVTHALRRPELGSVLGAIAIFLLFAGFDATPNHIWLHQTGIAAWLQQAAVFGILSVPVGLLMIGGEFDLSTGVMSGVTAIVMALLVAKWHVNAWVAVVITFAFCIVVGLVNGLLVVRTKLPSFIITLATFFVLRGVSVGGVELLNNGNTVVSVNSGSPSGLASAKTVFGSSFLSSSALQSGYSTAILW